MSQLTLKPPLNSQIADPVKPNKVRAQPFNTTVPHATTIKPNQREVLQELVTYAHHGAPNSRKQVLPTYLRPRRRYYQDAWSARDRLRQSSLVCLLAEEEGHVAEPSSQFYDLSHKASFHELEVPFPGSAGSL